jgi:hypothetical protein
MTKFPLDGRINSTAPADSLVSTATALLFDTAAPVLLIAFLLFVTAGGSAGRASSTAPKVVAASDSFSQLVDQYLHEAEQRDPLFADGIGVHDYDDRLPDYSPSGVAAGYAWETAWRARFAALDASRLGPVEQADLRALTDSIDADLLEAHTLRPYATDPTIYVNAIGDAAYLITSRNYAPLDTRMAALAKRLRHIPDLVRAAEASLDHPSKVSAELAVAQNRGNIDLYQHDIPQLAKTVSPQTREAITAALPAVIASLNDFQAFLAGPLLAQATGQTRVGAPVFDAELRFVNGTDTPRVVLVQRAQANFAATRARMLALALPLDRQFFPGRTHTQQGDALINAVVGEVLDRLAQQHPARDQVFAVAKADLAGIEAFLTRDPVVRLPVPNTLQVVPTPEFQAGVAGASLDSPGPFTPLAGSHYNIDQIPASWSPERVESYLREYNNYEMRILTLHEAIPGHYVQFRYNAQTPSLVRRIWENGSFVEGWAVYGEGMMLDAGYGGGDPALRLFQLKWRLREYANAIIDAQYHTGGLTKEQCFALLRQAFQEPSEMETKWHRLELSHDQLSSYFVGLDAITQARAANHDDLATFNRKLLDMGSVEPRFVAPLLQAMH